MPFEKLEIVQKGGETSLPASIILRGKVRPRAIVSLARDFVDDCFDQSIRKFSVLIGTGDHAGKLRIEQDKVGILEPRELKGSLSFDLGHIPAIGEEERRKVRTNARQIRAGLAEIDIPDFAAIPAERDEVAPEADDDADDDRPEISGDDLDRRPLVDALEIDLSHDNERVTFRGSFAEVTKRQAHFVQLLKRALPSPCDQSFLVNALWDGRPPATAVTTLSQIASDLRHGLAPLRLTVEFVRGVGYRIREI